MDLPEWYSGSDQSGRVAAGIERLIARMDDHEADERDLERIDELLEVEREENWRAFLLSLSGTILFDLERYEEAGEVFGDALGAYKTHLPSFDETLSVYCQSCYTAGILFFDREMYQQAIPWLLRCLPYIHEVSDEAYVGDIYTLLNVSFSMIDDFTSALVFAEAAGFSRKHDCDSLENLMVAYYGVGNFDRALEIFHLLEQRCREAESFERILDFARKKLGAAGLVN